MCKWQLPWSAMCVLVFATCGCLGDSYETGVPVADWKGSHSEAERKSLSNPNSRSAQDFFPDLDDNRQNSSTLPRRLRSTLPNRPVTTLPDRGKTRESTLPRRAASTLPSRGPTTTPVRRPMNTNAIR